MINNSIKELSRALDSKVISSVELTTLFIEQIDRNSQLNAFISMDPVYALAEAQRADDRIRRGEHTPLTGLPIAHKDVFSTPHFKTTCGSKMLANYQSPYAATIVHQLANAGVVTLGKTNMDEFSMGNSNTSSFFGTVANPWNTERTPGGSSGGSAAAVAARLITCATGSDTGGSVRQPAAFCGVSGIKPTYGLASRWGMTAYASSLDQAGLIAKSAEDLALVLPYMLGFDEKDSTSVDRPTDALQNSLEQSIKGIRIGVPDCFFNSDLSPEIAVVIKTALHELEKIGAIICPINLKLTELWVACYYVIACAEASSNLSRYDGVRFGHRSNAASSIKELIINSRTEGFGDEVKRRLLTGAYVLSSGYFDAYYAQALKVRRLIQDELIDCFKEVDLIASPTAPSVAWQLNAPISDPKQQYLADIYTVGANLAGIPALSIPAGFFQDLPVGLQLMGNFYSEATLLRVAHHYQQVTNWHLESPVKELK